MDYKFDETRTVCEKCAETIRQVFHEQGGLEKLKEIILEIPDINVKVKDTNENGETEWFWINNPRIIGDKVVGSVNNNLVRLNYKVGEIVKINIESIQNFC